MSLFGSLMGDMDDDFLMGNHMNAMNMQMRSMNRLMNSFMPDPFNMLMPFDNGFQQNALMERGNPMGAGLFGFPAMPNINRLLSPDMGAPNGASYCSSSVISMSSGPDGRPQIYQATSSTKTGPGGVRETRKTVQDSTKGIKKMAIGHHIGERSHIIEKEQDLHSGQMEERQEFINLDEEEAESFDREFTNRARVGPGGRSRQMLTIEPADDDDDDQPRHHNRHALQQHQHHHHRKLPALPAPPLQQQQPQQPHQHNNSSTTATAAKRATATTSTSILSSPKHGHTSSTTSGLSASSVRTKGNTNANAIDIAMQNNNNNNYLSSAQRRVYRSHLTGGATPRRPLRTPTSSPLTTTPINYSHSTTTTPSVHPHPYNASAARRNYRSKHTKQHQQPHAQTTEIVDITDDAPTITTTQVAPSECVAAANNSNSTNMAKH